MYMMEFRNHNQEFIKNVLLWNFQKELCSIKLYLNLIRATKYLAMENNDWMSLAKN